MYHCGGLKLNFIKARPSSGFAACSKSYLFCSNRYSVPTQVNCVYPVITQLYHEKCGCVIINPHCSYKVKWIKLDPASLPYAVDSKNVIFAHYLLYIRCHKVEL